MTPASNLPRIGLETINMRPTTFVLLASSLLMVHTAAAFAQGTPQAVDAVVEPGQITLTHAHDLQRLLVSGKLADGSLRDFTALVKYHPADAKIVGVDAQGVVMPKGVGQTEIAIIGPGIKQKVSIGVKSVDARPVSFAHDIMPILTRAGCNSGACHGAASGKKGFKISLRGYDPANDYI